MPEENNHKQDLTDDEKRNLVSDKKAETKSSIFKQYNFKYKRAK